MFSDAIKRLRAEAELVSGANCMMLAEEYKKPYKHEYFNKIQVTGLTLNAGGVLGVMGLAAANMAAASGSAGILSSASTALAGLGTVAVGTTVLPAAAVIALGVGFVGVATLGIGTLTKHMFKNPIYQAGIDDSELSCAIRNDDRKTLNEIGARNTGIGDWLKGAKNLVVKSIRESIFGEVDHSHVKTETKEAGLDVAVITYPPFECAGRHVGRPGMR